MDHCFSKPKVTSSNVTEDKIQTYFLKRDLKWLIDYENCCRSVLKLTNDQWMHEWFHSILWINRHFVAKELCLWSVPVENAVFHGPTGLWNFETTAWLRPWDGSCPAWSMSLIVHAGSANKISHVSMNRACGLELVVLCSRATQHDKVSEITQQTSTDENIHKVLCWKIDYRSTLAPTDRIPKQLSVSLMTSSASPLFTLWQHVLFWLNSSDLRCATLT